MKHTANWYTYLLLAVLALCMQSCLGIGGSQNSSPNSSFKQATTTSGSSIGVNTSNQALFKGKLYFTQQGILYTLDGNRGLRQLTQRGVQVTDPAVSPNGKLVAFVIRHQNYSDLAYMSTNGGPIHTVVTGNGHFYQNSAGFTQSDYYWFAQPSWSQDGSHLLFLSDLQKLYLWANRGLGNDFDQAPFLDLQIFSLPINTPTLTGTQAISVAQIVAYADYGNGGDRDPAYRPHHSDQIVYTHYTYDAASRTQEVIQLYMENPMAIVTHPQLHYHPGDPGASFDPGVPITPANVQVIQPVFSPNGNSIAYIQRESKGQMGLYVMPVPEAITTTPDDKAAEAKALVPYKSSSLIVTGQYVSQPAWSPDGRQIAYLTYSNFEFDIWLATVIVDSKTGVYKMQSNPIQLTSGGVDGISRPFWTP
jgi:hypothetical protein